MAGLSLFQDLADAKPAHWLAAVDPRLRIGWVISLSVAALFVDSHAALVALLVAGVTPLLAIRLRWRGWVATISVVLLTVLGTVLTQAMFISYGPRTEVLRLLPAFEIGGWTFPGIALYREGAIAGAVQSMRMVALTLAGLAVCLCTSPHQLLAALVQLRMPTALAFITAVALRFIPVVIGEFSLIRQARRLRGYRSSGWTSLWRDAALVGPVLHACLRRATVLATSVTIRGFDADAPRTAYPPLVLRPIEHVFAWLLATGCLGLAIAKILLWLHQGDVFSAAGLQPFYAWVDKWL